MKLHFYKFHGNGNDFIIIDNRDNTVVLSTSQIKNLCHRRFGIGADGLMMLVNSDILDFEMVYYNSDGNISSMCGNGGRCIAAFANMMGIVSKIMKFDAYDGAHKAVIENETQSGFEWDISLQLADIKDIEINNEFYFLDTGSPHYVKFVDNVADIDVNKEGKRIRDSYQFKPNGTNVNFVELVNNRIIVRTFERGVEQETLSCGTGVTAAAIAVSLQTGQKSVSVKTAGGNFKISFDFEDDKFSNVWLRGPAKLVFEGNINI
jgi:diaminopimelate epimerase